MLVQCKNCGAPLDGRDAKASIKCNYCGSISITEALPVQQAQVPAGWKPPQVWVAPPQFAAAGQQMAYRSAAVGIQFIVVGAGIVASLLGGGFAATRSHHGSSWSPGAATADAWTGKATYRCDGADQANFTGVTSSKLASVLEAGGACKVVVTGGTLHGTDSVINAKDGAKVELHNVKIIFSGHPQGAAIRAAGAAQIDLYDCTVSIGHGGGEVTAIDASGGSGVHIHGGKIDGRYVLRASGLGVIDATGGADVRGRVQKDGSARVEGVTERGGAATPGAAGDCGCAAHDHACKHKCKKGH